MSDTPWRKRTAFSYEGKEAVDAAKQQAKDGIDHWQEKLAEAFGVQKGDIKRTTGTELEFLAVSNNPDAFKARMQELTEMADDPTADYNKAPAYIPKELDPLIWQKKVSVVWKGRKFPAMTKSITTRTIEPSDYVNAIEWTLGPSREDGKSQTGFSNVLISAEVVSDAFDSKGAAEWQENIGTHLLEETVPEKYNNTYLDFRSKPTSNALANSMHMHMGLKVSLRALLQSQLFADAEKKGSLLERNVRFYRENLEAKGKDISLCDRILKDYKNGVSPEKILENPEKAALLENIGVHPFSRREFETDRITIDQEDLALRKCQQESGIHMNRTIFGASEEIRPIGADDLGKERLVGEDEVSQFGLIFSKTLEKFIHDCALVIAPTESSYDRFKPSTGAPLFNAGFPRKHLDFMGSYLLRGGGRISYGTHNPEGKPDKGPLRCEVRVFSSNAIGHPNPAYPDQKVMPWEIMEGVEAVFAKSAEQYNKYLQGKIPAITEADLFKTARACAEGFPQDKLLEDCVPEEQRLPKNRDQAVRLFHAEGRLAMEIYGKERLKGMEARRKALNQIEELDYRPRRPNPGPAVVRDSLAGEMPIDPHPLKTHQSYQGASAAR